MVETREAEQDALALGILEVVSGLQSAVQAPARPRKRIEPQSVGDLWYLAGHGPCAMHETGIRSVGDPCHDDRADQVVGWGRPG